MVILRDTSGLAEGISSIGNTLARVLENVSRTRAALTPFQQISTGLREKEQQQKTERGVLQAVSNLADPLKGGFLKSQDIIPITRDVSDLISKGLTPSQALSEGIQNYQFQQATIDDLDLGRYVPRKKEDLKESIVNALKENKVTNTILINRSLAQKRWPLKERKEILARVKGLQAGIPVREKQKFDITNPKHLKIRDEVLKQTKGDRKKAQEILERQFK